MMGLADRFIARGQTVRRFHMYADGRTMLRLELGRNGSSFGFMLDVPQDETETILRRRVAELGGRLEPGHELRRPGQDPDRVTPLGADGGGERGRTPHWRGG